MLTSRLTGSPSVPSTALVPASRNLSIGVGDRLRTSAPTTLKGDVLEGALVGHVLASRYHVRAVIGGGGTSIVYRGWDQRLGRDVAIKVLAGHTLRAEGVSFLRARFAREARMAAGIRHPNVVSIFDQGTEGSLGIDFLVLELLEGGTLASLIRKFGRPRLSATVRLLRQAAAGLAAGHRAGLVHRDVSPTNLFLEASGSEVRLKILSFGAGDAGRIEGFGEGGLPRDLPSSFASPEQLRGDHPLTTASDVFSLGAVAYHLLTGRRVRESIEANRAFREMEAARDALLQDRTVPLKLREVVGQALASHPADRFGDAREMLIALDGVHVGEMREAVAGSVGVDAEIIPVSADPGPRPVPATPQAPAPVYGLPPRAVRAGFGFVLAMVGAICLLTAVAGHWNTIAAALTILTAAALSPLPGEVGSGVRTARFLALASATLLLLGIMVARAISGSIPDLLAAQMIVSRILLWINSPSASARR